MAFRVPKRVVVLTVATLTLASGFGVAFVGLSPSTGATASATSALPIGSSHIAGTVTPPVPSRAQPAGTAVGTHLTIVPIFGSTVTSSSLASQIESAFNYVVDQYEAEYSDPITIDVNVAYTGSGLGESDQTLFCYTYATAASAFHACWKRLLPCRLDGRSWPRGRKWPRGSVAARRTPSGRACRRSSSAGTSCPLPACRPHVCWS